MQDTVSGALCFVRSCVKSLNPWENLRQVELLTTPFANKETEAQGNQITDVHAC